MPKKSNISPPLHLPTVDNPVKTSLEAKSKSAINFIANFTHHDVSLTQLDTPLPNQSFTKPNIPTPLLTPY